MKSCWNSDLWIGRCKVAVMTMGAGKQSSAFKWTAAVSDIFYSLSHLPSHTDMRHDWPHWNTTRISLGEQNAATHTHAHTHTHRHQRTHTCSQEFLAKQREIRDCCAHRECPNHNFSDQTVGADGGLCPRPTERRTTPAGQGQVDTVFSTLMLVGHTQSQLVDSVPQMSNS